MTEVENSMEHMQKKNRGDIIRGHMDLTFDFGISEQSFS